MGICELGTYSAPERGLSLFMVAVVSAARIESGRSKL